MYSLQTAVRYSSKCSTPLHSSRIPIGYSRGVYRSDPNFDSHSYTTTRIPLRRGRRGKCRNACGRRDSHAQRPMLAADASHTRGPGGTCRHARAHMRDSRRHRRERGRSGARSNGNRPAKNASRKSCGSCLTTRVGARRTHQHPKRLRWSLSTY